MISATEQIAGDPDADQKLRQKSLEHAFQRVTQTQRMVLNAKDQLDQAEEQLAAAVAHLKALSK